MNFGFELLPVWREIGMGFFLYEWQSHEYRKEKIPYESRMAHSKFPMNGLAGVMKLEFPTRGGAASGEFLFYHNC